MPHKFIQSKNSSELRFEFAQKTHTACSQQSAYTNTLHHYCDCSSDKSNFLWENIECQISCFTPTATATDNQDSDDIYLDYAATTPVDPDVARSMHDFLTVSGTFGNPSSITHKFGHSAMVAVENARQQVANLVSANPEEIIWTSGGTESINIAIKGAAQAHQIHGTHIITSVLEHKATLDTAQWLESQGFSISYIKPGADGTVTTKEVSEALRPDTILVSLMHVNNETGSLTDIQSISHLLRRHGALFHVDVIQSAARLPLNRIVSDVDLISISGHKIYGPKGIGALCSREHLRPKLVPQIHGGGHEFGLRPGTLPTHQIVGMGHAADLVQKRFEIDTKHLHALDKQLLHYLNQLGGVQINGSSQHRAPGILNICFNNIEAESLMLALGGIAISSGSACTSANTEPSHVLIGLGYSVERALSSVRISFGRFTTSEQINRTGALLQQAVVALRKLA